SGVIPRRSTRTPLACSITARLRIAVRTPVSSARSLATSAASASAGSALVALSAAAPPPTSAFVPFFGIAQPSPHARCNNLCPPGGFCLGPPLVDVYHQSLRVVVWPRRASNRWGISSDEDRRGFRTCEPAGDLW